MERRMETPDSLRGVGRRGRDLWSVLQLSGALTLGRSETGESLKSSVSTLLEDQASLSLEGGGGGREVRRRGGEEERRKGRSCSSDGRILRDDASEQNTCHRNTSSDTSSSGPQENEHRVLYPTCCRHIRRTPQGETHNFISVLSPLEVKSDDSPLEDGDVVEETGLWWRRQVGGGGDGSVVEETGLWWRRRVGGGGDGSVVEDTGRWSEQDDTEITEQSSSSSSSSSPRSLQRALQTDPEH
ncbi:unnamed protein product [Pleuronectes platessa]|uniref:Uncharacterized protein n=1 Tax=Pleuronectes platessa TaxID=8262 RepID=A0A9N7VB86_PLEPL|nr:unnamed protein product [Pleuronectes platessa]